MKDVFCLRFIFVGLLVAAASGCRAPQKSCCCGAAPAAAPAMVGGTAFDLQADWQDDAGKPFHLEALQGRPVLISMFYASCEGICVITKNDMQAVEASLPASAQKQTDFVLVTLAPERDSVAVLRQYRVEHALGQRWHLLRGSPKATAELAAWLGISYGRDQAGLFRHSSEITALDGAGKILLRQEGLQADLAQMAKVLAAAAR